MTPYFIYGLGKSDLVILHTHIHTFQSALWSFPELQIGL